jgi:hypothetical protein
MPIVGSIKLQMHIGPARNKIVFELKGLHSVEVANRAQKLLWEYNMANGTLDSAANISDADLQKEF